MYLAVVFVTLLRISSCINFNLGLDRIFHGLTGGKIYLFNFGRFDDSDSFAEDGNTQADEAHQVTRFPTSATPSGSSEIHTNIHSRILEDSLESIVRKESEVLNLRNVTAPLAIIIGKKESIAKDSLEKVSKDASEAEKLLEGSSETVARKASEKGQILKNSLETSVSGKASKAEQVFEGSLEKVDGKAGKVLEGSLETGAGKAGSVGKVLEGSLETGAGKAGSVGKILEGSLESSVAGKTSKAEQVLEGSLEKVDEKAGKVLEGSLEKVGGKAGKVLEGSLETGAGKTVSVGKILESSVESSVAGKASKAEQVLEGSLETVDGKKGKVIEGALETVAGKTGKVEKVLEGSLETSDVGKASEAGQVLDGSLETVDGKAEKGLEGSLETVSEKAGSVGKVLRGSLETSVAGKAGKITSGSTLKDTLGTVTGRVDDAKSGMNFDDSLETITGKSKETAIDSSEAVAKTAVGAVGGSVLTDTSETIAGKTGKTKKGSNLDDPSQIVIEKAGGAVSGSALGDSLKTISGRTNGQVLSSLDVGSLGTVAGKGGKTGNLKDSIGTITGKGKRVVSGSVLQDSLENMDEVYSEGFLYEDSSYIIPVMYGETYESGLSSIYDGGEVRGDGLKGRKQKVTRAISSKSAANIQQNIIQEDIVERKNCFPKSDVTSFPSVPAVSKFVHIFLQGVHSSELLTMLFNIPDATPLQLSQFNYRLTTDMLRRIGLIDASDIAASSVRNIAKYFDTLIPQVLERIYANAFANYFFAEGFLTNDNAEELALAYLSMMEESAEENGVSCACDYHRNFQALGDGTFSLTFLPGPPTSSQAWEIAFYYAHEWLLAAVDYRPLNET